MHIIFDLDGTLIDTAPVVDHIVSDLFHEIDLDISPAQVTACAAYTGLGVPEKFIRIAAHYGYSVPKTAYEFLGEEHERRKAGIYESGDVRVFDGVENTLMCLLEEGHTLSIGTSNPSAPAKDVLARLGLEGLFKGQIFGADHNEGQTKPHPGIFLCAMEDKLAKETIVIEDSLSGALAAQNAGIKCLVFDSCGLSAQEKAAFREVGVMDFFTSYSNLPKVLRSNFPV